MQPEFRELRQLQLDHSLIPFKAAKKEVRPQRGWLRAIRQGLGLSLENVAQKLGIARRRILEFEVAEANDRITLRSLRRVADALDCELVYAIVPKTGSLRELAERRTRARVARDVLEVENTMDLEAQSVGQVDRLIDKETQARLKKAR